MFRTDVALALADMGLNALPIAKMEQDALIAGANTLRRANPDVEPSAQDILREANCILPSASDNAGSLRLFWSMKRELEDGPINALTDLADFITDRAQSLESQSVKGLDESTTFKGWVQSLSRLAEAYSYVIEAATSLEDMGMVALRRKEYLEKLTTVPDGQDSYASNQLFTKASAIYIERVEQDKPALQEQYR